MTSHGTGFAVELKGEVPATERQVTPKKRGYVAVGISVLPNTISKALPNLRFLVSRRCASDSLIRSLMPNELPELESLRFEDEMSVTELGYALDHTRNSPLVV